MKEERRLLMLIDPPALIAFACLLVVVFVSQTWPFWQSGRLLPGIHADGAFHYYSELARLDPTLFPRDLAITSNRQLGYYEHFYQLANGFARLSGLGLMRANHLLCWLGNALYLLGVVVLLRRFGLSPTWCFVGGLMVAQVYVLIAMWSGLVHSIAIPREFWLWPLPWFILWFVSSERHGSQLLLFYGVLAGVYALNYPLWATLFGMAFGLADIWRIAQARAYSDLLWLGGSAVLAMALVAAPALTILRVTGREESSVLDYNAISRSVYLTKGFRRLILFTLLGIGALFLLRKGGSWPPSTARLAALMIGPFLICCVYEPIQRFLPSLSFLYLGRLSLVVYFVASVLVILALSHDFPGWPLGAKAAAILGLTLLCLEPQRVLNKETRPANLPSNRDFITFAEKVKAQTPVDTLGLLPPETGSHYFRVFAERGLWIDPKDSGILSRTKAIYQIAQDRLARQRKFYQESTSPSERAGLLADFAREGIDFIATRVGSPIAPSVTWPVTWESNGWEFRARPKNP